MMQNRIRLLEFITGFQVGGTERQFVLLGKHLDRANFDLSMACLNRCGEFLKPIEELEVPLDHYRIRSLASWRAIVERARLASSLRLHDIDILHSYGYYPNLFAIPAAWAARVPVIVASIRDTGEWTTPAQKRAQALVCRLADHVLVNARAVLDRLVKEGYDRGRISVIENGVDLSRFSGHPRRGALRAELGLDPGAPLVAVLARMHNSIYGTDLKGIRYFLDAAAGLSRRFGAARFLVLGDGPLRAELERYAAGLGLGDRVLFMGFRLDVAEILSEIDVAVSPSLAEAISNSVIEAMAAGLPVVGTRVGGTPEAVEDGVTGLLVPPRDSEALARCIGLLLEDRDLASRLGRAGRRRIEERFSTERMVRATERVYGSLIEEARRRSSPGWPRRWARRPAGTAPRTASQP
jgi:glycosyltransferase involved in cell wall biosynthesis